MRSSNLPDEIPYDDLLRVYLETARSSVARIHQALHPDGSVSTEPVLALVHRLSHNLKGSSFQFGFEEPGLVGKAIENLSAAVMLGGGVLSADDLAAYDEAMVCLTEQMDALDRGDAMPDPKAVCERLEERLAKRLEKP